MNTVFVELIFDSGPNCRALRANSSTCSPGDVVEVPVELMERYERLAREFRNAETELFAYEK